MTHEKGWYIDVNRSLEEVNSNLHGWLEGDSKPQEEVTSDVKENSKRTGVRSLKTMPALLQSRDKTLMDKELLLMDEPRKWFLEM